MRFFFAFSAMMKVLKEDGVSKGNISKAAKSMEKIREIRNLNENQRLLTLAQGPSLTTA